VIEMWNILIPVAVIGIVETYKGRLFDAVKAFSNRIGGR